MSKDSRASDERQPDSGSRILHFFRSAPHRGDAYTRDAAYVSGRSLVDLLRIIPADSADRPALLAALAACRAIVSGR